MTATLAPGPQARTDRPEVAWLTVAPSDGHHLGTTCVAPESETQPPPSPRKVTGVSPNELFELLGALVSALCLTMLMFGRLTAWSGKVGFVVFFVVAFLAIYALLVSLSDDRVAVVDRLMAALMACAGVLAIVALSSVVFETFKAGLKAVFRPNLYTQDMSLAGPQTGLEIGGISHAIMGSLIIIGLALVITVPMAIVCAVYLTETRGKFVELVRSVVTAMTALPSVVAGLFIFVTWILILGYPKSGFAAALAISLMMLPIIVRSADVVLRLVPGNLREAAQALGAPRWRVVWHVVLPTAKSGLATSVILGVARGIGETAPVLLVAGNATAWNINPFDGPMNSLPLTTFTFVASGVPNLETRGFAAASVLMFVVLILFGLARVAGGKPAGQLSKRQRRRAASKSLRDLERFEPRRDMADTPVHDETSARPTAGIS